MGDASAQFHYLLQMFLATSLGGVIGFERQWRQRFAGLRTNSLVATGSSLFVILSREIPGNGDNQRIAAQIVSGVGFLGAGVIMREGLSIRGLNTAATLWCSAAIGALAGSGFGFLAISGAMIVLLSNILLRPLAQKINRQPVRSEEHEVRYQIKVICREAEEARLRYLLLQSVSASPLVLKSLHSEDLNGSHRVEVTANVDSLGKKDTTCEQIVARLSLETGVSAVTWLDLVPNSAEVA